MFRHQSSQRILVCRAIFLLFGAAPTVAVLALVTVRLTDAMTVGTAETWAERLSTRLGVSVQIQDVVRPAPGVTSLQGVSMIDPETGETVLQAERLELSSSATVACQLEASGVKLPGKRLGRLWECLRDRILRSEWSNGDEPVRLRLRQLTVQGEEENWSVNEADATLERMESGTRLAVEFQVAGQNERAPARLQISRHRHLDPPTTSVELHTGAQPLPCSFAADLVPTVANLGRSCTFQGSLHAVLTSLGWEGDVEGRFQNVDFDALITANFPHKLSGLAEVEVEGLHFTSGRVTGGAGRVQASQGVVSHSLLLATRDHLQFGLAARAQTEPRRLWTYDRLACSFALDQRGTFLWGECDAKGAILMDAEGMLAASRLREPVETLAVLRSLVPESELLAPATRETEMLLRVLPMPAVVRPQQAREPYSGLRFRKSVR